MKYILVIVVFAASVWMTGCSPVTEAPTKISKPEAEHIKLSEALVNKLKSVEGIPETVTQQYLALRSELEMEFYDCRFLSNTNSYWEGPAAKEIISLNKSVLPLIMKEIELGNFFFNVPAQQITGLSMRVEGKFASEQEYAQRWFNWWQANRDNPQWNIYIEQAEGNPGIPY